MQNPVKPLPNTPMLPPASKGLPVLSSLPSSEIPGQPTAPCQNTAFYLHLPVPAGQQIKLTDLHTLPGGDYLGAARLITQNGETNGLLLRIDNNGVVRFQRTLTIDNQPCSIDDVFVTPEGIVHAIGVIQGNTRKIFLAQLNINLAVNWVNSIELPDQPIRAAITATEDSAIAWVAQSSTALHYGLFSQSGISRWTRQASPVNLTELSGIAKMNNTSIALSYHTQQGGMQASRFLEIRESDGTILWDFASENSAAEENKIQKTSYFNNRHRRLEIRRKGSGTFVLQRHLQFYANSNETAQNFDIPGLNDFTATAAMDPSGDLMGICLPATGQVFLLKQFADYQTSLEIARQYQAPIGSSLVDIARSFDGGFLLGLNTQAANEILLIKTDSSGQLPECGFTNPSIRSTEVMNTQNQVQITSSQARSINILASIAVMNTVTLTGSFDCFANTCRPKPPEDSCLSSYYRVFRSNSYAELVSEYALMRNNRHLLSTNRFDRVLGFGNSMRSALKLMDDRGSMLRAVNLIQNNTAIEFQTHRIDDQSIMLIGNSSAPNAPRFDITLVTDNLDVVWSRSLGTQFEFYSAGMGIGDVQKDQQGNYYLAGTTLGFGEGPKCTIVKLDASGNLVWNKTYQWADGLFGVVSITCTENAVVAIIETSNTNKTTLRLHKDDGRLLNSYRFKYGTSNAANFYLYKHLFTYSDGRILYAGHGDNDYFMMGALDTTGKPISFKSIQHQASIMRAGTVNNGNLYATYYYFDGSRYREFLLKADSNLNLSFFRQSERVSGRLHKGLQVSSNGSIYASGYHYYQNYNFDSYLIKFDAEGRLGTCTIQDIIPPVVDISFSPVEVTPVLVNRTLPLTPNQVAFADDPNELVLSELLCSSTSNCSSINISGPEAVCEPDTDISYRFTTNPGCTLKPGWVYDTAIVQLRQLTDSTAVFRFRKAGNTLLIATLDAGCNQYKDSLRIIIQDARIRLSLGADTAFCPGDSIRLTAGPGYPTYRWQDGSTDSVYKVKQPGTYWVSVTNGCGIPYQDTIVVERHIVPSLFIGNDTIICPGNTITFRATPGFDRYNWTSSDGTGYIGRQIDVRVQNNLGMRILASTAEGCVATDSTDIKVFSAPVLNLGADLSVCDYDSALLSAGDNFSSYLWNNGSTLNSIRVSTTGLYWVQAKDNNGCIAADTVSIIVNPAPAFTLGHDRNLCAGETLVLDPGPFAQYNWQDASSNRTIDVQQAGTYWVTVTDTRGCRGSDSLRVNAILAVPANFLAASDTFCKYQRLELSPQGNFNAYLWSTGARQRTISVDRGGRYTLEVTDANGCRGSDTIQVVENNCLTGVFIPNAFTPNSDRLNDKFQALVYGNVIYFRLQVFNRFGELVFSTTDPRQGWDGIYKGKSSPAGNFAWQCSYHLEGSEPAYQKGTVILLR